MTTAVSRIRNPVFVGQPPKEVGSYLVGMERLRDCLAEARRLHAEHFKETEERYLDDVKVDPDYGRYLTQEDNGGVLYFTVRIRDSLRMVGNLGYLLQPSLHSSDMYAAYEDVFYIQPNHRRGRVAVELLRYAEQVLIKIGATHVAMSDKQPSGGVDLERFFVKRGYQPVARLFMKRLESDDES